MKQLPSVFIVDDNDREAIERLRNVSSFYIKPISRATLAEILQL